MSGLTKRDLLFFGWMVSAPFVSFVILTNEYSLSEMMDGGIWVRIGYGVMSSIVWLGVWCIALALDNMMKKVEVDANESE